MTFARSLNRAFGAILMSSAVLVASSALAQEELSDSHRQAAREAIRALGATDQFDMILPRAADQLKSTLIQATPNFEEAISATVDEVAITLAGRRSDLEREAGAIYARNFTEEELTAITDFYNSPAGQKLLENGSVVTRELLRAAEIWANGIARDLAVEADSALEARLGAEAPSSADAGIDPQTGTAEGEAPAVEEPATPAQ
ncbi:DUF2059 domain-containing protein [Pararhizobium haloflavum]|uniref:DUF2059 domain-containing protein n=1 Tax=Pararhizobium haloflavum TaxID=2037914 RepID=UPI000C1888CA|nr:DUF2059 domain-containing protein [Pararhizobium haloflavum]